ncbi:MAG: prepilin peptidase [Armatimonadetes bacterium]|nr:prepilin peptidase [Armatimonadota bacterium]
MLLPNVDNFARNMLVDVILVLMAFTGAFTDARSGKIYNWLTFPVMIIGLAINTTLGGFAGFKLSLAGLVVGLAIQYVPFWLNLIRGGDVKFLAAAGALKGPIFVTSGFLYGAAMFGLYATIVLAFKGKLRQSLQNVGEYLKSWIVLKTETDPGAPASLTYMPWGVTLALGFLLCLLFELRFGVPFFMLQ